MDKDKLLASLIDDYRRTHKKSEAMFNEAAGLLVRGGSHNLRLFEPYPFYDSHAEGSTISDIDGNSYVDFWQGHFGNVLGHNPPVVIDALNAMLQKGQGLSTGFPGTLQKELAALILKRIGAEKIRFTTSGTLSTMYAIMLAKASTGRELVIKVGGGWHGAHPLGLKGISSYSKNGDNGGLNQLESAGLSPQCDDATIVTKFNDGDDLEEQFKIFGERAACLIIEPFIGAGGFIFAHREYLEKTRRLTEKYGALLIFDEVISGFRFHAGGVQNLYGITPDLSVLGKVIGGGMPVSAVAGKSKVMELCNPATDALKQVRFEGGTFSAHPASMKAGITLIQHLIDHEEEIYPRIGRLGDEVRREIETIFARYGFHVRCTGGDETVTPHSSVVGVHFVDKSIQRITHPEETLNPNLCDHLMGNRVFKLAMLAEGFNIFHGYGTVSAAHGDEEIQASLDAVERIAKKWSKF